MINNLKTAHFLTIPEGKVARITNKKNNEIIWDWMDLPIDYQEVEWLSVPSNIGAYIDLGFSFDTAATIYMTQYIDGSVSSPAATYPFGAVENNGANRCCVSCPYGQKVYLYGTAESFIYSNVDYNDYYGKNEFIFTIKEGYLNAKNISLTNETLIKEGTNINQTSYSMTSNLYLFAQNYNGSPRFGGIRTLGPFKYYDKNNNLICYLKPCYHKETKELGMYDLVRRIFLTNIGAGSFNCGQDIVINPKFTNLVLSAVDENGEIYNYYGYADKMRWSMSGNEAVTHSVGRLSGWMPFVSGGVYRFKNFQFEGYTNTYATRGYIVAELADGATKAYSLTTTFYGNNMPEYDAQNDLMTFIWYNDNIKRFRISGYISPFSPIITLNEEII